MPPFTSALFKGTGADLFSPDQVQRLMRVEFDRAQRYRYPVVMLLVAVDRLAQLQDLYGSELKEQVLQALTRLLKTDTRACDSIASTVDDRALVLVPHATPEGGNAIAKRILEAMRGMQFECDGRPTRITVSIGGAHNQQRGELSFETMLQVAQGGVEVAQRGGGNRYVHSDLYEFFEQRRRAQSPRTAAPEPAPALAAPPAPRAPAPTLPVQPVQPAASGGHHILGDKIRELLGGESIDEALLARIEQQVITSVVREMRAQLDSAMADSNSEHRRQIELLERRISKLTDSLGVTEDELARVLRLKGIDAGVASIYRSVQGLSPDAVQAELKRELMSKIFQANVDLRKQITSGHPPGAEDTPKP
jgi:diguanylate cyclase (GGDEF)-like protein